mgnify:CR=1 FL=1
MVSIPKPPLALVLPSQVALGAVAHVVPKARAMVAFNESAANVPQLSSAAFTLQPFTNTVRWVVGDVDVKPEAPSVTVNDNVGVVSFNSESSVASADVTVIAGSVSSMIAVSLAINVVESVPSVQEVPQP